MYIYIYIYYIYIIYMYNIDRQIDRQILLFAGDLAILSLIKEVCRTKEYYDTCGLMVNFKSFSIFIKKEAFIKRINFSIQGRKTETTRHYTYYYTSFKFIPSGKKHVCTKNLMIK